MASLKKIASEVRDTAQDGIGFIILWKKGRSWEALEIWPEEFDYNRGTLTLDGDDAAEVRRILAEDPKAIVVNSYYHNLGMFEGEYLTVDTLARKLRWRYEECEDFLSEWEVSEVPRPDEGGITAKAEPEVKQVRVIFDGVLGNGDYVKDAAIRMPEGYTRRQLTDAIREAGYIQYMTPDMPHLMYLLN